MRQADLERVYEAMAEALDTVAPEDREVLLAKLVLALCDTLDDAERCLGAIDECRDGLIRRG